MQKDYKIPEQIVDAKEEKLLTELTDAYNKMIKPTKANEAFSKIGEKVMKCAYCGNEDEKTLWDEDDTIYCSRCCHRTRITDGKEDLVKCPHCGKMRDSKAYYCRHCNTPL